ncbi:hypothetical protein ACMA1I_14575, partial [Pontibacter sp. 13R65]|uniref:hypothetical protein n=1 Tax=Pontibacter sp. 13R65 TaxID=3127458 RepID=UPI00301C32ED
MAYLSDCGMLAISYAHSPIRCWLWSRMYDGGIKMAAEVLAESYVRDNYSAQVPLLPQFEGSK